jgi:hypothetical protein
MGLAPYFNPGTDWRQEARFTPVDGGKGYSSGLTYDPSSKTVTFSIPADLPNNKIYKFQLINVPTGSGNVDRNVTEQVKNTNQGDSSSLQIRTREATGTISKDEETGFLTYGIRTSIYKTFSDKMSSYTNVNVNMLYDVSPYVYYLQATIDGQEMFDKFEIYGDNNTQPLIQRKAELDTTPWYKTAVEPVIYKDYPLLGKATIDWRTTETYGVPPTGEIKIWQLNYDHILTDQEMETGVPTAITTWAQLMYALPYYWSKDYYDIRMKLANLYPTMTSSDAHVDAILKKVIWPVVDKGDYPVTFSYVLPGINKVTSSKTITFKDPFEIVQPSL